jgi:hypothetical protein
MFNLRLKWSEILSCIYYGMLFCVILIPLGLTIENPSQGCYSQDGDIVVLCAYLGQLARVRDALATQVAVVIDDRDQMALADQESEEDAEDISPDIAPAVEHINVAKRVGQQLVRVFNYLFILTTTRCAFGRWITIRVRRPRYLHPYQGQRRILTFKDHHFVARQEFRTFRR